MPRHARRRERDAGAMDHAAGCNSAKSVYWPQLLTEAETDVIARPPAPAAHFQPGAWREGGQQDSEGEGEGECSSAALRALARKVEQVLSFPGILSF